MSFHHRENSPQHDVGQQFTRRYGVDMVAADTAARSAKRVTPKVGAQRGMVVEEVTSGWVGEVTGVERIGAQWVVRLEDRRGRVKAFPMGPGFWIDGAAVELVPAQSLAPAGATKAAQRTASGSRTVENLQARTARASRIWVEGTHDAELVEKVWGYDLRVEGVVVEPLGGIDDLAAHVRAFQPGPGRRLGVLVDHLVAGSKEARIARDAVAKLPGAAHVMITGHPYVDVWQSIKPERVGLESWPQIPRSVEWKVGVLQHLKLPHATQADKAEGWKKILRTVRSYTDLEPALLREVESLIDFVTLDPKDR